MVMVVPTVGKPGCPGCNIKSFTGVTFVTGWASDITAISFSRESLFAPAAGAKPGLRTKLVIPMPGPEMGLNDMDGGVFAAKQCAAVRMVRESINEPVHTDPDPENRLTTWGN
jgi:hypothetical protein